MAEPISPQASGDQAAVQVVTALTEALNAGNVEAVMRLMAEDCVFENTYPAPDGRRYEGRPAVRAFWEEFFQSSQQPRFEIEEIFALGDRCILRWIYYWLDADGNPGHIRGVDIYRVHEDKIQEKLSYVKG